MLRVLSTVLAMAVAVTAISASMPSPAHAQQGIFKRFSFRDLFLPRRQPRVEPYYIEEPPPQRPRRIRKVPIKPHGTQGAQGTRGNVVRSKPAEPEIQIVEKKADARVVLVVGDFMGAGVAEGLSTVFAENPAIKVVDKTSGSSGFVRDDYFNWPEQAKILIDQEKPAAVVVMMGSNDRQQMRIGDTREAPMTAAWLKEYAARTEALAKALSERKVPFIWVGMPAFKSPKMTSDMLAFNDIYRNATERAGAEFVDIWDGFVDENGAFVTSGPDINGQSVRLRSDDGINISRSGKRKLAFYAEKPLNKILGITASGVAATPASLPQIGPGKLNVPVNIDRTVPVSLGDPALDGGTELMGAQTPQKRDARSPGEKLTIEGIAPKAAPGRADDFSWPPKPLPEATGPMTTTAIDR